MPISCSAGDLIESSKCILSCTDEGQRDAMKVWLLAQIAGVQATPGFLLEQSKCLDCLNDGQLKSIQAWLLCQVVNQGGSGGCPTIPLSPANLPDADNGTPYSQSITASGGSGPYIFVVIAGSLPTGLSLDFGGTLSGTPTVNGPYSFTVLALDANGCTGQNQYSVTVETSTNPIWNDLVAYWKMNEVGVGVNRMDSTPNAIDLQDSTCTGDVTNAAGLISNSAASVSNGSCLDFVGALPDIAASGYTIHGWMQADDVLFLGRLLGYQGGLSLRYVSGVWEFRHIGTSTTLISVVQNISTAGWTRFCARGINGGTVKLMIDTTEVSLPAPADVTYTFSGELNIIGDIVSGCDAGFRFDEISIWPRQLSDPEVAYLFNAGSGHTYNDP